MTLSTLIPRIEQAGADEQRELLEVAWAVMNPRDDDGYLAAWREREAFEIKLDAQAYLDAAMMVVPDGWRSYTADMSIEGRTRWMLVGPKTEWVEGLDGLLEAGSDWYQQAVANIPAMALLASICRAHMKEGEDGR